ncbi:galactosylceramide sulfotransferase-like [Liolophura sinensis]|uniref:galactosylceramide sulfotransferase-like n=1 Tax=Liolophura sinensis TaxID=3198878 RepID=UPI0031590CEE
MRQLTVLTSQGSDIKHLSSQEEEAVTIADADNQPRSSTCKERRHFAFLKVPKAGSSTVQNIFYRFGFNRNLTFLLPRFANFISYFPVIEKDNIIPPPKGKRYEAMCNHVVYNRTAFRLSLPVDSVFVSILRNPTTHLSSYLNYFHGHVFHGSKALEEYLVNPDLYSSWKGPRKIVPNIMANYFGLPERHQREATRHIVSDYLMQIETDFDFIIILERLDESLLLMKRKFCWKLKDIVYEKKQATALQKQRQLPDITVLRQFRLVAQVDFALYEHFLSELSNAVLKEERDTGDFNDELSYFRTIRDVIKRFCKSATPKIDNGTLRINASKWNDSFEWTTLDCRLLQMEELELLKFIGQQQYGVKEWQTLHTSKSKLV